MSFGDVINIILVEVEAKCLDRSIKGFRRCEHRLYSQIVIIYVFVHVMGEKIEIGSIYPNPCIE